MKDEKISFFNRGSWFKKKNICPECWKSGKVGHKLINKEWIICNRCNGDKTYHE